MAVTVDAKCAADTEINSVVGTTGITSTNLTVGATATALLACLIFDGSANLTTFAMHWDSTGGNVAMTQIGTTTYVSTVGQIVLFGLVNPTAGAKTLKATWVGTGVGYMASMSFIGTDTSSVATAFTNFNSATPTGATGTFNITGASGNYAFACNGNDDQTYTTFINATSSTLLFSDINNNYAGAAYAPEVGTTTTFSWAQAGSEQNVVAGCTVAVPAGGPINDNVSVTGVSATGFAAPLSLNTYANRISFSTPTTGTGTVTLGTAVSLYQLPSLISGITVGYTIVDQNRWEVGTGTYTASSPATVSRTTIESSCFGAGIPINLSGSAIMSLVVTAAMFTATAPFASPAFTGIPTAPTPSATTNSTRIATTAFVAPSYNDVGSNKLHNALFNIAQRTGPFTTSGYTLDRWAASLATDTVSITQATLADADRAAIGDEEAQFALQNVFTGNSGSAYNAIYQRIENVRRLSNKAVTVSLWAKALTTCYLGVSVDQNLGAGGSPANIFGNGVAILLSTTWTRYSTTFSFGSLSGLTVGTGGDTSSQLNFWFSAGANNAARAGGIPVQSNTIQLWGVQLEISSFASPLEKLDPRYDLYNCQRFFQYHTAVLISGYSGGNLNTDFAYPVTMRAVPTVALDTTSFSNASGLLDTPELSHIRFQITLTTVPLAGFSQTNVGLSADL